ncbi:MAG: hypothetical protein IPK08_17900 [Bacteroidetes bacterium]|nr:hypothetical protein [Bacteroidota bacterium]
MFSWLGQQNVSFWRNDGLFYLQTLAAHDLPSINGIPAAHIAALTIYQGIIYAINDSGQIYSSVDSAPKLESVFINSTNFIHCQCLGN